MPKILNFGSVNIDNVFRVDEFVRPGETIVAQSMEQLPGGKGLNQSVALAQAGAEVYHAGKIGPDGGWLLDLMEHAGVHTEFVEKTGSATGKAIIQVNNSGQNCIIVYHGANGEISKQDIDSTLQHFGKKDVVLLQNEINNILYLIDKAFDLGMEVVWNPSPFVPEMKNYPMEKISCFFLNEIEGYGLTGEKDPEKITQALLQRNPETKVVLTLGKGGVLYRDAHQTFRHGIYRVPVVDTTGAGDTFTGFFLAGITGGEKVEEALRLASVASSIEVSRKGAACAIPTMQEVRNAKLALQ
jgi:ribokinase